MTDHSASASIAESVKPNAEPARSDQWIDRLINGWSWRIRSDWLGLFESPQCPSWLDLKSDPRAKLFKSNKIRDVFRVETDHGAVFAKIARPITWSDRLRRLVLGPDSLREWRAAEYAARHDIATVVPVAAAWRRTKRREPASIFVTMETPDAEQLDTWWLRVGAGGTLPRKDRNAVIGAVAELIAQAHHGGFVHTDLHAGNILVRTDRDGGYSACFVDLQAVSVGRAVSEQRAIRNLAMFGNWFRSNASLTDRTRFLRVYVACRERLTEPGRCRPAGCRELVPGVDRAMRAHARALAAQRDRQALRNGRRFGILCLDRTTRAHVFLWARQAAPNSAVPTKPLTRRWWCESLASRWNFFSSLHDIIHKGTGEHLRGFFDLEVEDNEPIAVASLERRPTLGQQLKSILFSSQEMQLWKTGNALLNRGIPAARPLAVCERRFCGVLLYASILIENPTRVKPPHDFMDTQMKALPPSKRYRAMVSIAHQIAALFRRLDEEGFVYSDLKASDLAICVSPSSDDTPIVVLSGYLDLRQTSSRVPLANLPALVRLSESLREWSQVSRTDRLRVLKRYLNRLGRPAADWRKVWREMRGEPDGGREASLTGDERRA